MTRRALLVSPGYTIVDGSDPAYPVVNMIRSTPATALTAGLGALLDRVAKNVTGDMTLLLTPDALTALKFWPITDTAPALDDATAVGWKHGRPGGWTTFYGQGRPTIVVGVVGHPDLQRCPLVNPPSPLDTVASLALWHEHTGRAWRGTPGVAGMTLLRESLPKLQVPTRPPAKPSFSYPAGPPVDDAYELAWERGNWEWPQGAPYAHGWDCSRMYLAAAQGCELLAPWALKNTGRIDFSPKLAGWWKVKLGPWSQTGLPAPAGPGEETRWVTTPTLVLLAELIREAADRPELPSQDFEILDSWTGAGKRLLRSWATKVEQAYQAGRALTATEDDAGAHQDGARLMAAAKLVYKETLGLLKPNDGPEGTTVYRPDWHYAVIAQARSNLWRRLWHIARTENRWPFRIVADHVWYGSDNADPETAKPLGIPLVNAKGEPDTLGTFKWKPGR